MMEKITASVNFDDMKNSNLEIELTNMTKEILGDSYIDIHGKKAFSVSFVELGVLGTCVSSIIPTFHTVAQSVEVNVDGLYRISNLKMGDTLKMTKDGGFWGALKTDSGKSKMAKLEEVKSVRGSSKIVFPMNPAIIMMAVTLACIEKN